MVAIATEKLQTKYILVKINEAKRKDSMKLQSRITGGEFPAEINLDRHQQGSKPYLVFIWDVRPDADGGHPQGRQKCTGVIISSRYILTAMHCYDNSVGQDRDRRYDAKIPNRRIYFGIYDTTNRDRALGGVNDTTDFSRLPAWRMPKSIKTLYRCTDLICCDFWPCERWPRKIELYNRDTNINLLTRTGIQTYNTERNLIDLALVQIDPGVPSVDTYDYRRENYITLLPEGYVFPFFPLKAAEIDSVQTDVNNCQTCTGDCSTQTVFSAQGWGRYDRYILESSVKPRWTKMKCTTTCRNSDINGVNKCELFRTTLAWKKEFCVESFAHPGEKGTCQGDSGGPLTRYSQEQLYSTFNGGTQNITSPVFVIVGILTGKACGGANFCSHPMESSYVNLRDPDIHRFLREEVLFLNCKIDNDQSCTLINRPT